MPDSRVVHANGINLHYLDWPGGSPAIVCLHGITGQVHVWDEVAEALSPKHRLIALDQRGHGDSDKPATGYAADDFVADVEGLVVALGLEKFILMGHSMGARNAIVYAERYGHRLPRLILEDPGSIRRPVTGSALNAVLEREKRRPLTFASFEEAVEFVADEADLQSTQPRMAYWNQEAMRRYAEGALRQRADGAWEWKYSREAIPQIIASRTEEADQEVLANLHRITMPTLLVRGGVSPVCSPENAEALRQGIPNCRVAEVEGAGHNVHQQKPAEFLVPVQQFLNE